MNTIILITIQKMETQKLGNFTETGWWDQISENSTTGSPTFDDQLNSYFHLREFQRNNTLHKIY